MFFQNKQIELPNVVVQMLII